MGPFFPLVAEARGVDSGIVGLVFTTQYFGAILILPFFSILEDKFERRHLSMVGSII